MPRGPLYIDVKLRMVVNIIKFPVTWWKWPIQKLAMLLIRTGCWLAGAEVTVTDQPFDWQKKTPTINIDSFMRP